jgi:cell division protein ZipA
MNELRIMLLLLGVGVIIAVYAWTRFQQHQPRRRPVRRREKLPEAPRADEPDADEIEQELARMQRLLADDEKPDVVAEAGIEAEGRSAVSSGAEGEHEEVSDPHPEPQPAPPPIDVPGLVIVSIMAEAGQVFSGEALSRAFQHNRLRLGEQSIYQRLVFRNSREQSVFSVANLVKPGTFPSDGLEQFSTPGLTLFLQLPAPIDDLEAFDDFVTTAERLAVELGGELRDEHHQLLSHQQLMQVRDSLAVDGSSKVSSPA